ncbi:MAG: prolyl oligopeptidase family serine peptidase [Bacteroidales bacterium]|nr:prolyl oligopeptidase family serine peptidase [Bacteroidales bacterium]
MAKTLVFIFFILQYAYVSAQDEIVIAGDNLPGNDTVWVYKPAGYNRINKYPAVYLLHGINGDYSSWGRLVNLQHYADKYGFIIVCPDGFKDSFYFNSPRIKNLQYELFFVTSLYPKILNAYTIDSTKVFITGLSMGGAGAMYLFLRNHHLFLSAASTSGVLDLGFSNSKSSLKRLLGDNYSESSIISTYSAISYLENISGTDKQILFDCGTEDHLYECNNLFRKRCDELKIMATYISQPGTHSSAYWSKSIEYHFKFFGSLISQP